MKGSKLIAIALVLVLAATSLALAQKREITDTSYIDRAQQAIAWMKDVIKQMQDSLKQARQEQNAKKIECIETRVVDIQRLTAEIEAHYKNMREYSFNKKIQALRNEFALLDQKRKVVEQLVKLVNECLGRSFEEGAFTETVQEFLGLLEDLGEDPTASRWEDFWPEPLPPTYEPIPASLAENE